MTVGRVRSILSENGFSCSELTAGTSLPTPPSHEAAFLQHYRSRLLRRCLRTWYPLTSTFPQSRMSQSKSWQARHTGIRIVQQIAIMMGCAVLPHLRNLVACIAHGLQDEQQKVRTMTALEPAALAEAAALYGIESFDEVLKPLWPSIRLHCGKGLAAFLKAIGFIIPLMDPGYVSYYTKEVTVILI
ncbi:hypothetical protein M405DRAFT_95257 [Rhizopogon salebrosus TDB-379]|nr:hypothetical protein M405DRAFT_95257 [Rhizopogon salebrosus TDB-379]